MAKRNMQKTWTPSDRACVRQTHLYLEELNSYSRIPPWNDDADSTIAGCEGAGFSAWNVANSVLVCVPRVCTRLFIAAYILPGWFRGRIPWSDNRLGIINDTQLMRMRPLKALPIDFIIAGFCHSGTTTLDKWLSEHPQVSMWPEEIHEFLWQPSFAAKDLSMFSVMPYASLKGIRSTWAATSREVMWSLSRNPNIKVIVVCRDPLSQLNSILSHGTTAFFNPLGQPLGLKLMNTATLILDTLQHIPNENIMMVPFAHLAASPLRTMAAVHQFLGLDDMFHTQRLSRPIKRHSHPARLPIPTWQSLCDVPVDWQAPAVAKAGLGKLTFLDILHAHFARERRRLDELLNMYGWPEPRLNFFSCQHDLECVAPTHALPGYDGFCHVAHELIEQGKLDKNCPVGNACVECCVFQQASCRKDRECCAPVIMLLQEVAEQSVREAFCGDHRGCSTKFMHVP